jgi:hypothetical protein
MIGTFNTNLSLSGENVPARAIIAKNLASLKHSKSIEILRRVET